MATMRNASPETRVWLSQRICAPRPARSRLTCSVGTVLGSAIGDAAGGLTEYKSRTVRRRNAGRV